MVMMARRGEVIDSDGRQRIREAIAAAEARTAGEVFAVVARASDDYRVIPLLWATLVALVVPLPLLFLTLLPALLVYGIQLGVFVVLAVALSLPAIKPLVVPATIEARQAHRLAMEQFLAHGLHMTEARTGVLIFVSLAERYAEVVADAGIAASVDQAAWDELIAGLIEATRRGRLADGLVAAIGASGDILARHFPVKATDRDELANDLVII